MNATPRRGELWWCEPPDIGRRPVVILSRDAAIPRLEVVLEPGDDPIPRRCAVNLDSVESVSLASLVDRIGALSGDRLREICAALAVATDC